MRKPALAGLLLCALIFMAHSPNVSAERADILPLETNINRAGELAIKEAIDEPPKPVPPPPITHVIKKSESLTSIAKAHDTTWKRIYDKNTSIKNPDVIEVGSEITIPASDETLDERPLPTTQQKEASVATKPATPGFTSRSYFRGSSAGNGYVRGYCTWYAKNRRPDLPNNLGNADTWVARARAQGIPTGSAPRVGAIGQQGMHVVYVEKVNSNGTVTISEMNYTGWNVVSSRTVAASNFMYIY